MTTSVLWPYIVVLLVGALPNEVFRIAAVFLARGLSEETELFQWVKVVAVTLLAAVVSEIVVTPPAALATVPSWVSVLSIAFGVCTFLASRILFASILAGEAAFVIVAWWIG